MRRRILDRTARLVAATGLLASAFFASVSLPALAQADKWPEKPVKFILPYAPGGATDLIGRPWAEVLHTAFGQQFIIENRGGASGAIGVEATMKSPPDGYTFLLTPNAPLTVLPSMRKVPYDVAKNFTPVARVGDLVCGFVIHPSVGVSSVKELVDYAKKNPGKLSYGSAGLGTSTHLRLEMFKYRAGMDILHVPYRGSADALNDLLPGTVQMMNEINVIPHVKTGKLKLLAISYSTRHPDFPDVPTLTEAGYPDSDVPIWYSLWAPTGTPADIVAKLNAKVVEIAKTSEMKARMQGINVVVPLQTPAEMTAFYNEDLARNADVIKAAKITLE